MKPIFKLFQITILAASVALVLSACSGKDSVAEAAAAEEAAAAARRAHQSNHRELAEIAQAKRHTLNNVYLPGYDTCAAGAGDTFFPAGFSEFAGYSDSAKELLKQIQRTGDSLEHDEEGDRFDGGAVVTWATRTHRAFLTHSVATAAAKALYSALRAEVLKLAKPAKPPSAKAIAFRNRAQTALAHARRTSAQHRALFAMS